MDAVPERALRPCERRRVKNGTPSTHPLQGDEVRALRRLQRESKPSPFVFVSERGTPFTTAGFARMIERAARKGLGLELKASRTCFATPVPMRWPTRGMIPERSKDGLGTGVSEIAEALGIGRASVYR